MRKEGLKIWHSQDILKQKGQRRVVHNLTKAMKDWKLCRSMIAHIMKGHSIN